MDYTILVNKDNIFNKDKYNYKLVNVQSSYKENMMLEEETYNNWLALKKNAEEKGYDIEIMSAYRSYEYQTSLLDKLIKEKGKEYAYKAIALPGYSEHQTGLALDYCVFKDKCFIIEHNIEETKECAYVISNAHLFGFVIRYLKGKEEITGYQYEPWHLRYVGKKLASYIYTHNLTLDEYYLTKKD